MVWSAQYSSFGKASVDVGTLTNNLRFAGQYSDSETSLHYNFKRYYDPFIGRYISTDPIDGGINLYNYANMNLVNTADPEGLFHYVDILLYNNFYTDSDSWTFLEHMDLSNYSSVYRQDVLPQIQVLQSNINLKAAELSYVLNNGEMRPYNISRNFNAVGTSIYSFGKCMLNAEANCSIVGTECGAEADCMLNFSVSDTFIDPYDLHEKSNVPYPYANVGGTPFTFSLSWSESYSYSHNK